MWAHTSGIFRFGKPSWIFLVIFTLTGCAAQKTYELAADARKLVEEASRLEPANPDSERALVAYEAGEVHLREARFGRASDNFKNAERLALKVIHGSEMKQSEAAERSLPGAPPAIQEMAKSESAPDVPNPEPVKPTAERMQLPAAALAAYLASKKAAEASEEEVAEVTPPKEEVKLPPKKTALTAPEYVGDGSPPKKESDEKMDKIASDLIEEDSAQVIEAGAEPVAKRAPLPETSKPKKVIVEPEGGVPEITSDEAAIAEEYGPKKIKQPGLLRFRDEDDALTPKTMGELDKMSRTLVANPSNTLLLVGTLRETEEKQWLERRFESIKSYLTNRGVPDDQVRLDNQTKSGQLASFEMFLIEH